MPDIDIHPETVFLLLLPVPFLYFLPSFIAHERKHSKLTAIRILNLLLGWTFVGWIIAIVWAYKEDNKYQRPQDRGHP